MYRKFLESLLLLRLLRLLFSLSNSTDPEQFLPLRRFFVAEGESGENGCVGEGAVDEERKSRPWFLSVSFSFAPLLASPRRARISHYLLLNERFLRINIFQYLMLLSNSSKFQRVPGAPAPLFS